jgi:hypothetical protein
VKILKYDPKYNYGPIGSNTRAGLTIPDEFPKYDLTEVKDLYNFVVTIFNDVTNSLINMSNHINNEMAPNMNVPLLELTYSIVYPVKEALALVTELEKNILFFMSKIYDLTLILPTLDFADARSLSDIEDEIMQNITNNGYATMTGGGATLKDVHQKVLEIKEKLSFVQSSFGSFDFLKEHTKFSKLQEAIDKINKLKTKVEQVGNQTNLEYFDIDLTSAKIPKNTIDFITGEVKKSRISSNVIAEENTTTESKMKEFVKEIEIKIKLYGDLILKIRSKMANEIKNKLTLNNFKYMKDINYSNTDFTLSGGKESELFGDINSKQIMIKDIKSIIKKLKEALTTLKNDPDTYLNIMSMYNSLSSMKDLVTSKNPTTSDMGEKLMASSQELISKKRKELIEMTNSMIDEQYKKKAPLSKYFKEIISYINNYDKTIDDSINPIINLRHAIRDNQTQFTSAGIPMQVITRMMPYSKIDSLNNYMTEYKATVKSLLGLRKYFDTSLFTKLKDLDDLKIPMTNLKTNIELKLQELEAQKEKILLDINELSEKVSSFSPQGKVITEIFEDMKKKLTLLNKRLVETLEKMNNIFTDYKIDFIENLPKIEISESTMSGVGTGWYLAKGGGVTGDQKKIEEIIKDSSVSYKIISELLSKLSSVVDQFKHVSNEYLMSHLEILYENQYAIYHIFYLITIINEITSGKYNPPVVISHDLFERKVKIINEVNKQYLLFSSKRMKTFSELLNNIFREHENSSIILDESKKSFLDLLMFVHISDIN